MINRSIERFSLMVVVSATLMIMLLVPGGYYLSSTQYLRGILDAQSELSAYEVTGLIKSNPAMWRYEEIRLSELLERPTSDNVVESRRILGTDGKIIAWNMVTVKPPRITYNGDLDTSPPLRTIASAPRSSSIFATFRDSSGSIPPVTASRMFIFTRTAVFDFAAAITLFITNVMNLVRFSNDPPHLSFRLLRNGERNWLIR